MWRRRHLERRLTATGGALAALEVLEQPLQIRAQPRLDSLPPSRGAQAKPTPSPIPGIAATHLCDRPGGRHANRRGADTSYGNAKRRHDDSSKSLVRIFMIPPITTPTRHGRHTVPLAAGCSPRITRMPPMISRITMPSSGPGIPDSCPISRQEADGSSSLSRFHPSKPVSDGSEWREKPSHGSRLLPRPDTVKHRHTSRRRASSPTPKLTRRPMASPPSRAQRPATNSRNSPSRATQ